MNEAVCSVKGTVFSAYNRRLDFATPWNVPFTKNLTVTTNWVHFTWRALLVCVRFLQPW